MAPGSFRRPRSNGRVPTQATGDSQPPPVDNAQSGNTVAPALPRKTRGKATNAALNKILTATGAKIRTNIEPGRTRDKGKVGEMFAREIGIIVRAHIPLTCRNWQSVKICQRQMLYTRVLENFDIDISQQHVLMALNSYMARRFKDYRSELHNEYKAIRGTHNQKKQRIPKEVSKEDWENICDWFESDSFKKMSEQNCSNRAKNQTIHRGGSKPFICYQDEMRDETTQQPMSRIELYRITHWSQQKGWSNPNSENKYMEMLHLQSQPVPEGSTKLTDDEIADQILGTKSGYIVGVGHGVIRLPSASCTRSINEEMSDLAQQKEQAEKRADEAERRVAEAEKRTEEVNSQVQAQMLLIQELARKIDNINSQSS